MGDQKGFTLIELMLTISIVGVLASIATPKIGQLINRAHDGRTLGNLGVLRSSLAIYYADNEGRFPAFSPPFNQPAGYGTLLHDALIPHYISAIPAASPSGGYHRASNRVQLVWNHSGDSEDPDNDVGDGWKYDANPFDDIKPVGFKGMWGVVKVLCTHENSRGANWSTF